VQAGREDLVDAAVLQVGVEAAGQAQRVGTARWRPLQVDRPRACRRRASAACRAAGSAARPRARAGSRCGRPCGRPRSRDRAQHRRPVIEVELDVLAASPGSGSRSGCRRRSGSGSGFASGPAPCRSAAARPNPGKPMMFSTEWNLTSSRRAVLSARSRKLPMRRKWNASSCSIVPTVTPRDRCERNFTHSNASPGLFSKRRSRPTQVSLVPPPWLELTTSEPSFSATRVRPPGTMVT
jgi:hypothetical protein